MNNFINSVKLKRRVNERLASISFGGWVLCCNAGVGIYEAEAMKKLPKNICSVCGKRLYKNRSGIYVHKSYFRNGGE